MRVGWAWAAYVVCDMSVVGEDGVGWTEVRLTCQWGVRAERGSGLDIGDGVKHSNRSKSNGGTAKGNEKGSAEGRCISLWGGMRQAASSISGVTAQEQIRVRQWGLG
jgi:hypothetical protein